MATMLSAVSIQRFISLIGYHHLLMMLLFIALIILSLLIAGCTSASPGVPNIYLISLLYQNISLAPGQELDSINSNGNITAIFANLVNGTELEVRSGYFGLCVKRANSIWLCNSDTSGLQSQFQASEDPLQLIAASAKFKDSIVFPGLIIAAIVLALLTTVLLATFPGWTSEVDNETGSEVDVKPFPSRLVSQVALAANVLAALLMLVSILWQHIASVASATTVEKLGYASVRSTVGTTAMALGWTGLVLIIISAIMLYVMIRSIMVLDALTND